MNEFIQFIVDNWQFFSSIVISIVGFILLFIFKRRPLYSIFNHMYELATDIELAEYESEESGMNGKYKLWKVIEEFLGKHPEYSKKQVVDAVELFLSTPTKNPDWKGAKK